ncbi:hypothetical protein DUNSADRAFT_12242 [Dunaliella salina]|uniref:Guanylate cyclase domain-containing protein n=1 Tax=Dunaliella salina TaxID=3046 RepID=A0ABQ7GBP4_DUNSA|nr:hypothetical protein DUNSADRAFT_12242 [Dunaliella salina]|eukprot:KAF5832026.1 hypothetical protein DUNSADRAFT_12242 [Dunaliella salina]
MGNVCGGCNQATEQTSSGSEGHGRGPWDVHYTDSGQLDLQAFVESLEYNGGSSTLQELEAMLGRSPHAIIVARTSKIPVNNGHMPPGKGIKRSPVLTATSMSLYVSKLERLQQVGGSKSANDGSMAQLEALRKKQAAAQTHAYERTCLDLLFANCAAFEVLGAEHVRDWAEVHLKQDPMLMHLLGSIRRTEGSPEVHRHLIPARGDLGGLLQLDIVLCPLHDGIQEIEPVLLIGLKSSEQQGQLSSKPSDSSLHQKHGQPRLDTPPPQTKDPRANNAHQEADKPLGGFLTCQHQHHDLYLTLALLPVAVTLINSSGFIIWQNGRSVALLGLAKPGEKSSKCKLQHLFRHDPDALDNLLMALQEGQGWSCLVRVPWEAPCSASRSINSRGEDCIQGGKPPTSGPQGKDSGMHRSSKPLYHVGDLESKDCLNPHAVNSRHEHCVQPEESCPATLRSGLGPNDSVAAGESLSSATYTPGPDNGAPMAAEGAAGQWSSAVGDPEAPEAGFSFQSSLSGENAKESMPLPHPLNQDVGGDTGSTSASQQRGMSSKGPVRSSGVQSSEPTADRGCHKGTGQGHQEHAEGTVVPGSLPASLLTSSLRSRRHEQLASPSSGLHPALDAASTKGKHRGLSNLGLTPHQRQNLGAAGLNSSDSNVAAAARHADLHTVGERKSAAKCQAKSMEPRGETFKDVPPPNLSASQRLFRRRSLYFVNPQSEQDQDRANSGAQVSSSAFGNSGAFGVPEPANFYFDTIPEGNHSKDSNTGSGSVVQGRAGSGRLRAQGSIAAAAAAAAAAAEQHKPGGGGGDRAAEHRPSMDFNDLLDFEAAEFVDEHKPLQAGAATSCPSCHGPSRSKLLPFPSHLGTSHSQSGPLIEREQLARAATAVNSKRQGGQAHNSCTLPCASQHSTWDPKVPASMDHDKEDPAGPPSTCWHYLDAFTIKGLDGEQLTVLTNQDVTSLVDTSISLKQILDVEHKILEDIFPRHVLESQVAVGAAASLGRSVNGSVHGSMRSSRPPSKGTSNDGWERSLFTPRGIKRGDISPDRTGAPFNTSPPSTYSSAATKDVSTSHRGSPMHSNHPPGHQGSKQANPQTRTRHLSQGSLSILSQSSFDQSMPETLLATMPDQGHCLSETSRSLPCVRRPVQPPRSCGMEKLAAKHFRDNVKDQLAQATASSLVLRHKSSPGTSESAVRSPRAGNVLTGMGRHHENVTVMFADIKQFTNMSRAVSSAEVMHFLHTLFSQFDDLVDALEHLGLYKIETIGDCYMCAAGLLTRGEDGAMVLWDGDGSPVHHLFTLAKQMLEVAGRMEMPASGGQPVVLRIGMHTGPVTSGIAGRKCPRFCLFGDTVNFAARMESTCLPGMIHVSQATWEALGSPDQAADPRWKQTAGVEAKGIGFVQTYLWDRMGHSSGQLNLSYDS